MHLWDVVMNSVSIVGNATIDNAITKVNWFGVPLNIIIINIRINDFIIFSISKISRTSY